MKASVLAWVNASLMSGVVGCLHVPEHNSQHTNNTWPDVQDKLESGQVFEDPDTGVVFQSQSDGRPERDDEVCTSNLPPPQCSTQRQPLLHGGGGFFFVTLLELTRQEHSKHARLLISKRLTRLVALHTGTVAYRYSTYH